MLYKPLTALVSSPAVLYWQQVTAALGFPACTCVTPMWLVPTLTRSGMSAGAEVEDTNHQERPTLLPANHR